VLVYCHRRKVLITIRFEWSRTEEDYHFSGDRAVFRTVIWLWLERLRLAFLNKKNSTYNLKPFQSFQFKTKIKIFYKILFCLRNYQVLHALWQNRSRSHVKYILEVARYRTTAYCSRFRMMQLRNTGSYIAIMFQHK
jgi:hypothetical protein